MGIDRPNWGDGERAVRPLDPDRIAILRNGSADLDEALRDDTVPDRYARTVAHGFDAARLPMHEARDALPADLVSEWETSKAPDGHRLRNAQDAAITALDRLAPEVRTELVESFDALDAGIRSAILGELSLGGAAHGRMVSDAEVELIMGTPAGKILRGEWFNQTAVRNVGIVVSRFERIVKRMTDTEREAALDWFDSLSPQTQAAAMRALAAR